MKRVLYLILAAALVLALLCGGVMAADNDVVYVSASGSSENNGLTSDAPVATLAQAYENVNANGKIVVMGDITQGNLTFPAKVVTITGKDGETDYQGRIRTDPQNKTVWTLQAATKFEYLTFNNVYSAGAEFLSGPSLHFGQGIVFQSQGTPLEAELDSSGVPVFRDRNRFAIRMGGASDLASAELIMESGTLSWISGANNKKTTIGKSTIRLSNASVTDFISGGGTDGSTVNELEIELNGVTVPNLCIAGHKTANVGKANVTLTNCNINTIYDARPETSSNYSAKITDDVNVMVNGGKLSGTSFVLKNGNPSAKARNLTLSGLSGAQIAGGFSGWTNLTVTGSSDLYLPDTYQGPTGENFTVNAGSTVRLAKATNTAAPARMGEGSVQLHSSEPSGVVYVSATGSDLNDGHTASAPVKTLAKAYDIVTKSGTIIVMGDLTLGSQTFPAKAVTITGKDGETDYQGRINTDKSGAKPLWKLTAATTFENLTFNNVHDNGAEFYSGPSLHFGQGIVFQSQGLEIQPDLDTNGVPVNLDRNRFAVRLGGDSAIDSAEVTMESGTLSWISACNTGKQVGKATISLSGGASVTDFISGGGTKNSKVDEVEITLTGATLPYLSAGGHNNAQTGKVTATLTNCTIGKLYDARPDKSTDFSTNLTGNVNITVTGGKLSGTEFVLDAAKRTGSMNLTLSGLAAEDGMQITGSFAGWTNLTVTGNSDLYLPDAYQGPTGDSFTIDAGSTVRFSNKTNETIPVHTGAGDTTLDQRLPAIPDYEVKKLLSFTQNNYTSVSGESTDVNVQGTAIHENYMVVLSHRGFANIYDLSSQTPDVPLDTFPLGSYTGTTGGSAANHANQCMFGPVKWDESDPLPLLYVTIGNGAGYKQDDTGYWSRCAVERITRDENGNWTAQTVQVISINDEAYAPADNASGLTLGEDDQKRQIYKDVDGFVNTEGYQKISWGWPAFFVDYKPTENSSGKFYVHSARYRTTTSAEPTYRAKFGVGPYEESNNYIITEFDLPALPAELPESSEYALAHPVVLTPKQITDQFETPYDIYVTQGGTMYQGRIYYSFGFGGAGKGRADAIRVYDVAQRKQIKALDLTTAPFMAYEPEDCCIYQGKLALSLQTKELYVFDYIASDDKRIVRATCTQPGQESIYDLLTDAPLQTMETEEALGHDMTYHAESPATCTTDGTKEYYSCDRCNKNFADKTGTQELNDLTIEKIGHEMTHYTRIEPTYETEGHVEYWHCGRCGKYFADASGNTELTGSRVLPRLAYSGSNQISTSISTRPVKFPFTDVVSGSWYETGVRSAWEKGLINGVTATQFQPDGQLTTAQTIKLAAALHQLRTNGKVTLTNGRPWYASYLEYAIVNDVIEAEYRSRTAAELNAPVTRGEFVHILHGALSSYPAINTLADGAIPDVGAKDTYSAEIYEFYRAGILTGSDAAGTFHAENTIQRSEAAAILNRMFDASTRQRLTLQ